MIAGFRRTVLSQETWMGGCFGKKDREEEQPLTQAPVLTQSQILDHRRQAELEARRKARETRKAQAETAIKPAPKKRLDEFEGW
eukprot:m.113699 g.113699  ORF g.113699 m.113699 type:complete len:84 (-) comp51871_c0_seq6:168-419(-)